MTIELSSCNLHDATLLIIVLALNKHEKIKGAAAELGITDRTLYNYMRTYDICWSQPDYRYYIKKQKTA